MQKTRTWTLRADNQNHHHGVISLAENPLCLQLCWRESKGSQVHQVGLFKLDLPDLLEQGFIRRELTRSNDAVRVRVVRDNPYFFLQVNDKGPRLSLESMRLK